MPLYKVHVGRAAIYWQSGYVCWTAKNEEDIINRFEEEGQDGITQHIKEKIIEDTGESGFWTLDEIEEICE